MSLIAAIVHVVPATVESDDATIRSTPIILLDGFKNTIVFRTRLTRGPIARNIFLPCASESFPLKGLMQNSKSAANEESVAIAAETLDMLPPA